MNKFDLGKRISGINYNVKSLLNKAALFCTIEGTMSRNKEVTFVMYNINFGW